MSAPGDTEASRFGNIVGDNGGGDLVHLHSAVLLGNVDRGQAKLTGFLDQVAADGEVFVLNLVDVRDDLFQRKLFGRLGDLAMLVGEVLRSEDLFGLNIFDEKAAACDFRLGNCCRCHSNLQKTTEYGGTEERRLWSRADYVVTSYAAPQMATMRNLFLLPSGLPCSPCSI